MIDRATTTLTNQLTATGIPGGTVVVVHDGRVEARGVGRTGSQGDVRPDTPFMLGSTSKSFTALAVMQLVDSGAVDLEDPVRDYVPELDLADGQPVGEITVGQVLAQTSGLSDLSAGPVVASAAGGTPLDAVAELEGASLVSPPGQEWHYANVNYVLTGLIVERASGISYPDYVQQRIFDPLQMDHSYLSVDAARADGLSQGHQFWFGIPVASGPKQSAAMLAAGYLISTAEDLGRYLTMYLADGIGPDGTQIVSTEGLAMMLAPGPVAHLGPWAQGIASHYAMGWFVGGPWSDTALFHPGNSPDSSSMVSFFPDSGVAVATLLNAGHELPVPGNPSITDRVSRNVIHAALGQDTTQLPSLRRFYLAFDAVVLVILALATWGLTRVITATRRRARGAHTARRWTGVGIRTLGVITLVLGVSALYGWAPLWTWAPDLALALATLALLWAATAALRMIPLLRQRHTTPPATRGGREQEQAHGSSWDRSAAEPTPSRPAG
ncbi:MAG: serine hydrolase domain-containing protein [Candidatus Nanopelagicales bacterium]